MSEQGLIQNTADETSAPLSDSVRELPVIQAPKRDMFVGISSKPFSEHSAQILMSSLPESDVEIRPDGIVYLPEIKYRRRLNLAFGPGGWAVMPRGPFTMQDNTMTREYAMYVDGRYVSQAVGEQDYIPNNPNMTYATASEGVRSNAIMRCCKDIGVASELWDPVFIVAWKAKYAVQVWVKGKNKPMWRRKDREPFFGESGFVKEQSAPQREQTEPLPVSGDVSPVQEAASVPVDGSPEPFVIPDDAKEDTLRKVFTKVQLVKEFPGTNKQTKKPFVRFSIKTTDKQGVERWFTTFSQTLGKVAKEVTGTEQTLVYSTSFWDGKEQFDLENFER